MLYPLILLAILDDPMPAMIKYVSPEAGDDDGDGDELKAYTEADFLARTCLTAETAAELRDLLADRKQLLFYGPPGTGKTFVARELGKLLTGLAEPSPERMEIVQFHPAYGYEDFIEGIRPESKPGANGTHVVDYPTRAGLFLRFCQTARTVDGPCVFIIDEMNRGNIARIFGELMFLLEYRDQSVPLPYSSSRFGIPDNVFIIGTMNTADRSIALVDFALRRRFHFYHFGADPELLQRWLAANPVGIPYLLELYRRLAEEAIDDPAFAIGPSHFMRPNLTETRLRLLWKRSIEPYLEEYYFDKRTNVDRWRWEGEIVAGIRGRAAYVAE